MGGGWVTIASETAVKPLDKVSSVSP